MRHPLKLQTVGSLDRFLVSANVIRKEDNVHVAGLFHLNLVSTCASSVFLRRGYIDKKQKDLYVTVGFMSDPEAFRYSGWMTLKDRNVDDAGIDATLCIRTPNKEMEVVHGLYDSFPLSQVSFWTDTSVTMADIASDANTATGEVMFGGVDYTRFNLATTKRFAIKDVYNKEQPSKGWETSQPVLLRVQSDSLAINSNVIFDIAAQATLLPPDVFESVVGPLKKLLVNPLATKPGFDDGVLGQIDGFIGQESTKYRFACKYTKWLSPFKIGDLIVEKHMLFDKEDNECIIRIAQQPAGKPVVVGFHLIKHFYMSVSFNSIAGSTVTVSSRKASEQPGALCAIC